MAKRTKRRRFIMILGVKVKIKYTSKVLYDGDTELHGSYFADTHTIHISNHSDVNATLFHECLHAAIQISGVGNLLSAKAEETVVSAIEAGLKDYFLF